MIPFFSFALSKVAAQFLMSNIFASNSVGGYIRAGSIKD